MTRSTAPTLPHLRLAVLADTLSEYVLHYGLTEQSRHGVEALERALDAYVLRYGLTEKARVAIRSADDETCPASYE